MTMKNRLSNWLVSSKLTWGISQILTLALKNLKNLHFKDTIKAYIYTIKACFYKHNTLL